MKTSIKSIFGACMAVFTITLTQAQVGIGTLSPTAGTKFEIVGSGTTSATTSLRVGTSSGTIFSVRNDGLVEISSTTQGFLPPRVALTATNSTSPISSPATGLLVYNTTAGTSTATTNVTPGLYYYDGSKWQRIINQQPDATVNFNTSDPNSGSPTFNPNSPASTDYVYVSTVNNSQWTWNGSAYVTYTPPASTAWYLSGGTNDAGSNKTGSIYRSGRVGIGTNNPGTALEVSSGVTNNAGLKFTNFNSTTPTSGGATLGVDATGNVVTVQGSSFSPSFGSVASSSTINVNAGSASLLASITLPTTGTYLINYTMRVQATTATPNQYAVGYLSNNSAPGSPIVGTEILGAFSLTAFVTGGNYSGTYVVTVTSAPQSLHFIGAAIGGQMGFLDDVNGRTRISYVKVTP